MSDSSVYKLSKNISSAQNHLQTRCMLVIRTSFMTRQFLLLIVCIFVLHKSWSYWDSKVIIDRLIDHHTQYVHVSEQCVSVSVCRSGSVCGACCTEKVPVPSPDSSSSSVKTQERWRKMTKVCANSRNTRRYTLFYWTLLFPVVFYRVLLYFTRLYPTLLFPVSLYCVVFYCSIISNSTLLILLYPDHFY